MTRNFKFSEFLRWPYRQVNMSDSDRIKATNLMLEHMTIDHVLQAERLAKEAQTIRNDFAAQFGETPFTVLCWLRAPKWETYRKRNGKTTHQYGFAGDFRPAKWEKVHQDWMNQRLKDWDGGMKVYSWGFHIDLGRKRRW